MDKFLDKITNILIKISTGIFLIVLVVDVANAVGRKAFNAPITGAMDIVQYGVLFFMALAMGRTGYEDRHLSIRMLGEYLPKRVFDWIQAIGYIISAGLYLVLMGSYAVNLPEYISEGRVTDVIKLPYYFIYIALIIAMLMTGITFLFQAIKCITGKANLESVQMMTSKDELEKEEM